ncbi:cytochrome P450 4c3-like [Vanessa cardui]|uniref:CYP405A12 n=1 Tax=Vanessa cardui TaxID=171605 RepID=A0A2Z5CT62_VANCA|nr:cytochrome P450 4c3-like [Vanessa cardui]AXB26407.1 CYP405A12 [Vanessa cardui]
MFFLLLLCFMVCLVFLHDYFTRKRGYRWEKLSEFPGDTPLPIFGNGLQLGFDADESAHKLLAMWEKHGKQNIRLSLGSEDWILLTDPDDIGTILNHSTEISKPLERNMAMKPFFGNSVSTSEGERWRSTRKLMAPCFNFNTLEAKIDDVNKYCDRLFEVFDTYDENSHVELYRYLRPFMYDILCTSLMGVETNLLADPDHPYLKASGKVIKIVTYNYFSYWRNIRFLFTMSSQYTEMMDTIKTIKQNSTNIISARRKILNSIIEKTRNNNKNIDIDLEEIIESKLNNGGCLLDKLIFSKSSNGESTSDDIINEEITLLCFTGHYTTTATISHTLYCLAKYPEIQNRVLEEQRSIFNKNMHKKPTTQELNQMKYLEAVIKESIRVIPTVTKIGRQLQNDLRFKDGRVAPAGSSVLVFYEAAYKNPTVFPEPEKFNPDRFLDSMHTFAFVPFSAGPRNCIGFRFAWVAMKATISNILKRYEVSLGDAGTEPQFVSRLVTESKNGIHLKLKKRTY